MQINKIDNSTNFQAKIRINKNTKGQISNNFTISGATSSVASLLSSMTFESAARIMADKSHHTKPKFVKAFQNFKKLLEGIIS